MTGLSSAVPAIALLAALALVALGTRIALDNATRIARHYALSDFFIGVAILSIGSDFPELAISVNAALHVLAGQAASNLVVGNALGSCFGQIGLVMGVVGLMAPLTLPRGAVLRHGGVLMGAMAVLWLTGLDGRVGRLEGLVLVAAFAAYVRFLMGEEQAVEKLGGREHGGMLRPWLLLATGMAIVLGGAELVVMSALALAEELGVDQSLVAITVIGVGTSLPELTISFGAVLRGRVGMSVGNLIGSNILDVLLPIGLAAMVTPIDFAPALAHADLPLLGALTLLVLGALYRRAGVDRPAAALILGAYCAYLGLRVGWA